MHPLTIYREELRESINTDFEVELLDSNCSFSEGPVWNKDGFYLFSDIPANIISKLVPGQPKETYLSYSGCSDLLKVENEQYGSNGLAYYRDRLFICQHGNHRIAEWDRTSIKPLISSYNNRQLNSPNDLVVHEDGSVFFSDPPYGLKDGKLHPEKYQPVAGVYCWRNGLLELFCDEYQYPNGVCLSPDGNSLYICSNKPFEAKVLEFDTKTLALKRTVCNEASDGIKCDKLENLYLCNKEGILIINNKGERAGLIKLSTIPANCCWGGQSLNDLFICARENIFLIKNLQKEKHM